mmetsp:Transcript_11622/g.27308  ORF Transcript_11622/g.27308 Transcript_11622/m.27308 type:complete len:318 (+) Transcript_11622:311-1264(+)
MVGEQPATAGRIGLTMATLAGAKALGAALPTLASVGATAQLLGVEAAAGEQAGVAAPAALAMGPGAKELGVVPAVAMGKGKETQREECVEAKAVARPFGVLVVEVLVAGVRTVVAGALLLGLLAGLGALMTLLVVRVPTKEVVVHMAKVRALAVQLGQVLAVGIGLGRRVAALAVGGAVAMLPAECAVGAAVGVVGLLQNGRHEEAMVVIPGTCGAAWVEVVLAASWAGLLLARAAACGVVEAQVTVVARRAAGCLDTAGRCRMGTGSCCVGSPPPVPCEFQLGMSSQAPCSDQSTLNCHLSRLDASMLRGDLLVTR